MAIVTNYGSVKPSALVANFSSRASDAKDARGWRMFH